MTQTTIFDAIAANRLAAEGLSAAGRDKQVLLARAKQIAIRIATSRADRTVTMDDVCEALFNEGIDPSALGNAAGSTFKCSRHWRYTGQTVKCRRPSSHGRLLRVWEFIGAE